MNLFHLNDNSQEIASVIEENCPKDLQSNLEVKSARQEISSKWFLSFFITYFFLFCFCFCLFNPSLAVIVNHGYF